jgi:peptidase C39-like protein/tetratricopeptide repeat protein
VVGLVPLLRSLAAACIALLASGCASLLPQSAALRDGLPPGLPQRAELTEVPFFPQTEYQCGPAALATALGAAGVAVTPEALVPQVYLPARQGSLQVEMMAAARRHGRVAYQLAPRFDDLLREIAAGTPVIVLQKLGLVGGWHYAVAVGYDHERGELILRSGENKRETLSFPAHELVWRRSDYWAMVAMPPERIPTTAQEGRWLDSIIAFERTNRSQSAYASFLRRWPDNINAAIGLANAHHAAGDFRAAEKVLREAERRDPNSVVVLNNLAQTLSDQGRNEEALPLVERAAAAGGPFSSQVKKTREAILGRLGRERRGVERLQ